MTRLCLLKYVGHRMRVVALHAACETNCRRSYVIASGSRDGTVRLWHPQSGEELRVLSHEHEEHSRSSPPVHRRQSLDSSKGRRDSFSSSGGTYAKSQQFSNGRCKYWHTIKSVLPKDQHANKKSTVLWGRGWFDVVTEYEVHNRLALLLPILLVSSVICRYGCHVT